MSNYQIVKDEKVFRDFIAWLPDLEPNEKFLVCLQARRKYCEELKSSDKVQLKRFTASKDDLYDKVKQLECPVGSFGLKRGGFIPQSALALYITPNPRCLRKASYQTIKEITDCLQVDKQCNPYAVALNAIHTSKSRTVFVDFDLDGEKPDAVDEFCRDLFDQDGYTIVKTRGGCHVLVRPELALKAVNWYGLIKNELSCDQVGDLLLPVPGCTQGDFIPHIWERPL